MTFHKGTIAKIKYFVRIVICKLGDAVPLLNTKPGGGQDRPSVNASGKFVTPWDAGSRAEQKRGGIESLNTKNRSLQLILEKVSQWDTPNITHVINTLSKSLCSTPTSFSCPTGLCSSQLAHLMEQEENKHTLVKHPFLGREDEPTGAHYLG